MNLVPFFDMDIQNPEEMASFFDGNAMVHETVFNALLDLGIAIEHYPLWRTGTNDADWLFIHDKEHKAISDALNLGTSPDLGVVDWKDQGQVTDWMQNHFLLHQQYEQVLGL
jgi:hypothetical protein